ncbi:FAD-binding protein [Novosphingobium sp. KCTC 2891]|uniref:FAD-binding protein n=1 Tax=Novosphingobium sp. KCTC 2891 TaxID=2989730 RepID=UPI002223830C|nr:FAD-binding protein [Novosphingobium sp. KCTC 2891]MCW1384084.1 FAD-binding protein [Novosphingobium sp. KCTC 2891]
MIASTILRADVLVIGGGMAAAWAAIAAAQAGASVVMADKGAVGTSGVTATGGPGHWWVSPDPALRREAIERQEAKALGLGDPEWMARIIDLTWRHLPDIAPFYPFGSDGSGGRYVQGVRGPEYMRALRSLASAAGVTILDHHPAIELLADADGAIVGARGIALDSEDVWDVRAPTTLMATGGCAFRSGLLGSHGNTGDGLLMAAEAGADLSGMEFGPSWSLSPAWSSTRTLPYFAARFFDDAGRELDIPPPKAGHAHLQALGRAMQRGPVLADLSDAPKALPGVLRSIQPLTLAAFERRGIDLWRERFPVRLFGEGTIRGTGGLRVIDDECRTSVPGLFAAGDAATRELVAGASSGGGAVNAAWALSSGRIAGLAAARQAAVSRRPAAITARGLGRVGLRPRRAPQPLELAALAQAVGSAVHGYDQAFQRDKAGLARSAATVDAHWRGLADHARAGGRALVELRAQAAMTATARWSLAAALARGESRGLHVREDAPATDPAKAHRLLVGGLDRVWTRADHPVTQGVAA